MKVSEEMLAAAMKKAVETGMLAKHADEATYLKKLERHEASVASCARCRWSLT
jgi:thiazole synthase ThiGH ThiG subunit